MNETYRECLEAANFISQRLDASGAIGLVLGSGLGELGNEIENPVSIDYKDIPNFPSTSVPGHAGKLICGTLNGTKVLCMQGRFHFYEGYSMDIVAMPTRVMKLLGQSFDPDQCCRRLQQDLQTGHPDVYRRLHQLHGRQSSLW